MSDAPLPLAEALYTYLAEIEEYRALCAQNQARARVQRRKEGICVSRRYALTEQAAACVRASLERLPGWEASPYWAAERQRWEELAAHLRTATVAPSDGVALRGVGWKGRALLVQASACLQERALNVAVMILPVRYPVLPELPLRSLALALACLEFLLPNFISTSLPVEADPGSDGSTIADFLKRTMPKNLYASQCILGLGAGHSAPAPPPHGHAGL